MSGIRDTDTGFPDWLLILIGTYLQKKGFSPDNLDDMTAAIDQGQKDHDDVVRLRREVAELRQELRGTIHVSSEVVDDEGPAPTRKPVRPAKGDKSWWNRDIRDLLRS